MLDPVRVVEAINSSDILERIYYMGAHTRKSFFATKIQKWYQSHKINNFGDLDTKGDYIRTLHRGYNDTIMMNYPTFSTNKLAMYNITAPPPFQGNKRSHVLKWIRENLTIYDMALVGY